MKYAIIYRNIVPLSNYILVILAAYDTLLNIDQLSMICMSQYKYRIGRLREWLGSRSYDAVKLPRIFPGAPLKINGAPGNIPRNLDRYNLAIFNSNSNKPNSLRSICFVLSTLGPDIGSNNINMCTHIATLSCVWKRLNCMQFMWF